MADEVNYELILQSLKDLHGGRERNAVANLANVSSYLSEVLKQTEKTSEINWLGFYFASTQEANNHEGAGSDASLVANGVNLVLGPFQGKWACTRIGKGKGVCGKAASLRETVVVSDVNDFPGHIACDGRSHSEIVVPLLSPEDGRVLAVLDIDSARLNTFNQADADGLRKISDWLVSVTDW